MVVDSSAILSILLQEDDRERYAKAIAGSADPEISSVSVLEATLVIGARKGTRGIDQLDDFLVLSGIRIVPFDPAQLRLAREAWWTFGKGRHAAGLNLGDVAVLHWRSRPANHFPTKKTT